MTYSRKPNLRFVVEAALPPINSSPAFKKIIINRQTHTHRISETHFFTISHFLSIPNFLHTCIGYMVDVAKHILCWRLQRKYMEYDISAFKVIDVRFLCVCYNSRHWLFILVWLKAGPSWGLMTLAWLKAWDMLQSNGKIVWGKCCILFVILY